MATTNKSYFNLNDIKLEDITSSGFNVAQGVEDSRRLLENYHDIMTEKITANFDDDEWVFRESYTRSNFHFDFTKSQILMKFSNFKNKDQLLIAIKCWVAKVLNESSLSVTKNKLSNINSYLYMSNIFENNDRAIKLINESMIEHITKKGDYEKNEVSDYLKFGFLSDLINFLTFLNFEEFNSLVNDLSSISNKLKLTVSYRDLPSFNDVLTITYYLDKWYEEVSESKEKLKYYPILVWWKITMIIPMRIVEFLHIKRENVVKNNEGCFITFPRMKKHRAGENRNILGYDTLPIPRELYNLIHEYFDLSSFYGESQYLISYNAFRFSINAAECNQENEIMFNYKDLTYLLSCFYKDILYTRYRISIVSINKLFQIYYSRKFLIKSLILDNSNGNVNSLIKPGDLRHLAIINMMMQGYDKVEIQRLSGHFIDTTQFSYFNHAENWLDVEILKMEREYKTYYISKDSSIIHPKSLEFIEHQSKKNFTQSMLYRNNKDKYIPLSLGMCKDSSMPCPSFSWKSRGCYFCDNWIITDDELIEKRNIILEDLNLMYTQVKDKIELIKVIFGRNIDPEDTINTKAKKDLAITSKEIQQDIKKIAKLKAMLGVINDE